MDAPEDLQTAANASTVVPQLGQRPSTIARVGVIGGGQLAWMMAPAAKKLNLELVVQTPRASDPAAAIASRTILAPLTDAGATAKLSQYCDVITFENEFVDLAALQRLQTEQQVTFYPPLNALTPLLDKATQRAYCQSIGLPTPKFIALDQSSLSQIGLEQISPEQISPEHSHLEQPMQSHKQVIEAAIAKLGLPIVLKTCRHGYDGQGTYILPNAAAVEATWQDLNFSPILLEEFISFDRELAIMVARSQSGEVATYPIVETQQVNQVCRRVNAPANITDGLIRTIEAMARSLMESLGAVGVFGIELFLTPDEQVLVNEIAPRTHNSGHYSLDACLTSQFEQQLRAVSGLPLGETALTCRRAVMVNLLGYEDSTSDYLDKRRQLAKLPNSHLYWYGKTHAHPERKLGHVTVRLGVGNRADPWTARDVITRVESLWYG